MKKYKILSLILAFLLCLGSIAPISASEDATANVPQYDQVILNGIGIESNAFSSDVTRGEWAVALAKAAGNLVVTEKSDKQLFSDVSLSQTNSLYIAGVFNADLMNGVGDGKFAPSSTITSRDAAVTLVRLAGYEIAALSYGGYPSGYLKIASNVGILDDVTVGTDSLTSDVASTLLYNALHTDVYQPVSMGDSTTYEARKGHDVLYVYHNIRRTEGLVTANRFTSLASADTSCTKDEIEIDKQVYKCTTDEMADFLGMSVVAYYRQSQSDKMGTMVAMYADDTVNKTVSLSDDDIISIDGYKITYADGDDEDDVTLIRGFNLIYNGKYYPSGTIKDLSAKGFDITLIDSDSTAGYETVVMNHGMTMVVTNIDRTAYKIYGENKAKVEFDSNADSSFFNITDTAGNELYIDRIKSGDVLTVFASKDNTKVEAVLCTDTISGEIISIDSQNGEIVVLSGKEEIIYTVAPGYEANIVLGLDGEFYLDAFGRLVYSDALPGGDFEYGYLINISANSAFSQPKLLILTAIDFEEFVVSDKFNLDGESVILTQSSENAIVSGGNAIPQVVRYKTDSKGELRYLDTTAAGSGDAKSDSLTLSKTISGTFRNEKFSSFSNQCTISSDTLCIKIPETASYKYDTKYYAVGSDVFVDDKSYSNVNVYDLDEALNPKVTVYKSDTGVSTSINDYSTCGIIKETGVMLLDKDGEKREAIRVFNVTGEEKTVYIDPEYNLDKDKLAELEFGDVIRYAADADGCLANWQYDYDYSAGTVAVTDSYFQRYVGYPYVKKDSAFSFLNLSGSPDLSAGIDDLMDHLLVFPTSVMTFIEVDFKNNEIVLSGYEYVDSFMHSGNTANKSYLKIYRGGGYYKDMLVTYKNAPVSD